jgi:alpha-galactosidase
MSMRHKVLMAAFAVLLAGLPAMPVRALDNGLARTPPMGWNSWNSFHCDVSADLVEATADAMVASGMKDAGYRIGGGDPAQPRARPGFHRRHCARVWRQDGR